MPINIAAPCRKNVKLPRLVGFDETAERGGGVQHVGAHAPGCHLTVAFGDRPHDRLVFVPGSAEPFALAQLRAPEGIQAVAHSDRLFGKEAIVGGVIDGFMELAVEAVIGIEISGFDGRL